jgi:uncharacterized protein YciI
MRLVYPGSPRAHDLAPAPPTVTAMRRLRLLHQLRSHRLGHEDLRRRWVSLPRTRRHTGYTTAPLGRPGERSVDGGAGSRQTPGVAEWIYFIHPPRDNFAETMTAEESAVWAEHFERLQRLLREGVLILAGPTLGPVNTGVAVFEAPDEAAARKIMEEDPVARSGFARTELRPFRVSLLRGRD